MKKPAPEKYLLDTSFMIAALEQERPYAKAAMEELIRRANLGSAILSVAAIVEAEMKVKDPTFKRNDKVELIEFGAVAADKLATILAQKHIKQPGQIKGYWKFDALTLACAIAGGAKYVVHEDDDFEAMAGPGKIPNITAVRSEEAEMGEMFGRPAAEARIAAEKAAAQAEKELKAKAAEEARVAKEAERAARAAKAEEAKAAKAAVTPPVTPAQTPTSGK